MYCNLPHNASPMGPLVPPDEAAQFPDAVEGSGSTAGWSVFGKNFPKHEGRAKQSCEDFAGSTVDALTGIPTGNVQSPLSSSNLSNSSLLPEYSPASTPIPVFNNGQNCDQRDLPETPSRLQTQGSSYVAPTNLHFVSVGESYTSNSKGAFASVCAPKNGVEAVAANPPVPQFDPVTQPRSFGVPGPAHNEVARTADAALAFPMDPSMPLQTFAMRYIVGTYTYGPELLNAFKDQESPTEQKLKGNVKWLYMCLWSLLLVCRENKSLQLLRWISKEKLIFQVCEGRTEEVAKLFGACPHSPFRKLTWGTLCNHIRTAAKNRGYDYPLFLDTPKSTPDCQVPSHRCLAFGIDINCALQDGLIQKDCFDAIVESLRIRLG